MSILANDDYDPALDAYRSWEVAIEALRAKKEAADREAAANEGEPNS